MSKGISVIVKYRDKNFGVYPTISAAAKAVEDYFENEKKVKRPSLYNGFCAMVRGSWIPDERSQLFEWTVEKQS